MTIDFGRYTPREIEIFNRAWSDLQLVAEITKRIKEKRNERISPR